MPSSELMDALITLVVYAMASARIAVLIAHDTILDRPRVWFFLRFPPEDNDALGYRFQRMDRKGRMLNEMFVRPASMLGELVTCTRCLTVWVTLVIVSAGVVFGHDAVMVVAGPVAAMWLAAFFARKI